MKTILQLSKKFLIFLVFLNISFNLYADPEPDSIRIAKRVNVAMEEFYAIQAQNEWNDANGLSENNVYVFGLGEFLEDPEEAYIWMPEGAKQVLNQTGLIRSEIITDLETYLINYNKYFKDTEKPYEIWVYLTPLNVGLDGTWENDRNDDGLTVPKSLEDIKARDTYRKMTPQEMYNILRKREDINIAEAEMFEYKVYSQILRKINQGKKNKVIYFQSNYVIIDGIKNGDFDLKIHTFKSISGGKLQDEWPKIFSVDNFKNEKENLDEILQLPAYYNETEKLLLTYPLFIHEQIQDYYIRDKRLFSDLNITFIGGNKLLNTSPVIVLNKVNPSEDDARTLKAFRNEIEQGNVYTNDKTISILAHGNPALFVSYTPDSGETPIFSDKTFEKFLEDYSDVWRGRGKNEGITIILMACRSGCDIMDRQATIKLRDSFAQRMSKSPIFKEVKIIAPSERVCFNAGRGDYLGAYKYSYTYPNGDKYDEDKAKRIPDQPGYWRVFKNGIEIERYRGDWMPHPNPSKITRLMYQMDIDINELIDK